MIIDKVTLTLLAACLIVVNPVPSQDEARAILELSKLPVLPPLRCGRSRRKDGALAGMDTSVLPTRGCTSIERSGGAGEERAIPNSVSVLKFRICMMKTY